MNIEEDVEHLKELQEELDYIVEHDNTHKALNSHRKSINKFCFKSFGGIKWV